MTREIVLDTETTGFEPSEGHRIVEIGCVELDGLLPTGNTFHVYINPQRDMPAGAYEVHGLSAEFLSGHPVFEAQAEAFIEFIGDAPLVIHNASFDMKFINAQDLTASSTQEMIKGMIQAGCFRSVSVAPVCASQTRMHINGPRYRFIVCPSAFASSELFTAVLITTWWP